MTLLTCTPDNVAEFRAALRAEPDLYAFVAALHQTGLIDGLRHAELATHPDTLPVRAGAVQPVLSLEAEARLAAKGQPT
jgi:hypothetical protein